jgi:hypothetical protein
VVIAAFSWALLDECGCRLVVDSMSGNKKPLVPQARRGQRVGRETGALGDYEDAAGAAVNEQAGVGH